MSRTYFESELKRMQDSHMGSKFGYNNFKESEVYKYNKICEEAKSGKKFEHKKVKAVLKKM